MNSGQGVIHSERPHKELVEKGGAFELIQFWVNTPAKYKMDEYSYQPLTEEETPSSISEDGKVKIGIVAGKLNDKAGPVETKSPMLMLRIEAEKDGFDKIEIPAEMNSMLYVLDGLVSVNGQKASSRQLVIFQNDGSEVDLVFEEDTRAIILSGEPINEPVVSYGPFVMNSEKEIMQAMQDYQNGKLGVLTEDFD